MGIFSGVEKVPHHTMGGDGAEVATQAVEFVIALIRRTVNRSARAAPAARNCAIKIASIKISIMNVY